MEPIFRDLPEDLRARLLQVGRLRRFAKGEVLFHEGDPANALHVLQKGRVAIRVTTPLGQVATINVLGRGEVFGEVPLLGTDPTRSASAVALEPVETLSLREGDLAAVAREHPAINEMLTRLIVERLRATTAQLLEALYVPADVRVRRRLLGLCATYGDGEDAVEIPLKQEEIAGLAGTTRATVNRVLREEADRKTVGLARGRITVLDREALARRAR